MAAETKICTKCGDEKSLTEYYLSGYTSKCTGNPTYQSRCIECVNDAAKLYAKSPTGKRVYKTYRSLTKVKAAVRLSTRKATIRLREELFHGYGTRCQCCGESNPVFLTLDHIHNDGYVERKIRHTHKIWRAVIAAGFPKDYRLLCYNCNCGRSRSRYENTGICPHISSPVSEDGLYPDW